MDIFERLDSIGLPQLNLLDREVYVRNMKFMHALMVASEPLVQDAIDWTSNPALRSYYRKHIEEERGHAEWLADDLGSMGEETETDLIAAACAGAQYYMIRHVHPVALLGYMAVLEGYPMPIEHVEQLEQAHGTDAVRTLRYHAENDVEHRKDLVAMLNSLSPEHKKLVSDNAVQTLNLLHVGLR